MKLAVSAVAAAALVDVAVASAPAIVIKVATITNPSIQPADRI